MIDKMDIIKTFGGMVMKRVLHDPAGARRLLLGGYRTKALAMRALPNRKLPPSKQYAAKLVMDVVIRALSHPERAAIVSIFAPCEPLFAAGITPYSIETIAGYLSGTKCERAFLEHASGEGIPETLCSFHRVFLGAADAGMMPKPRFMVYTNLACDGNMITFPYLKKKYGIPAYFIDVPYDKNEDSVHSVAEQLREMTKFISDITGRPVDEQFLQTAVGYSARSAKNYLEYCAHMDHHLTGDLTSEMYTVFLSHILLGTKQADRFFEMLLDDIKQAPESHGKRLLWLHLVPYMQPSARKYLNFSDNVFIAACDLAYESMVDMNPQKPYESMARRMVYSPYNGNPDVRISRALEMAERTGADGAVLFAQWGCKSTLGASQIVKSALEKAGLPTLILDGDGCDQSNVSDGQVATRLGAFLEMLEEKR